MDCKCDYTKVTLWKVEYLATYLGKKGRWSDSEFQNEVAKEEREPLGLWED